jgi:hypothetical protein
VRARNDPLARPEDDDPGRRMTWSGRRTTVPEESGSSPGLPGCIWGQAHGDLFQHRGNRWNGSGTAMTRRVSIVLVLDIKAEDRCTSISRLEKHWFSGEPRRVGFVCIRNSKIVNQLKCAGVTPRVLSRMDFRRHQAGGRPSAPSCLPRPDGRRTWTQACSGFGWSAKLKRLA